MSLLVILLSSMHAFALSNMSTVAKCDNPKSTKKFIS
jgi:hypothetical protein